MKKIVVIEDQTVMASIYRAKLASEGFAVEIASDGQSGLDLINRTMPDLVLLDIMLPQLNGVEVLKKLRENPMFQNLPVIIFSMSSQAHLVEEAWESGATMVLSKSNTSPKMVVDMIRKELEDVPETSPAALYSAAVAQPAPRAVLKQQLLMEPIGVDEFQLTDSAGALAKNKIVIVDDNRILRELYQKKFTAAGYDVHVAADGQEGLDLINDINPHLVLLDLMLPIVSGIQVLERLRTNPRFENLPIFIFSNSEWVGKSLAVGPTKVLSKPANCPSDILEMVQRLLPVTADFAGVSNGQGNGHSFISDDAPTIGLFA